MLMSTCFAEYCISPAEPPSHHIAAVMGVNDVKTFRNEQSFHLFWALTGLLTAVFMVYFTLDVHQDHDNNFIIQQQFIIVFVTMLACCC